MYITSVTRLKRLTNNLIFPTRGFEIFYISFDPEITLSYLANRHAFKGIKRIIVPDMILLHTLNTQKTVVAKAQAQQRIKTYQKDEHTPTKSVTRNLRTITKPTHALDLTPVFLRILEIMPSLHKRTSAIFERILMMRATDNRKVLVLTFTPDVVSQFDTFLRALLRDLRADDSHILYTFDYVVFHITDKEDFSELYVVNPSNVPKNRILALIQYIRKLVTTLQKIKGKQLDNKITRILKKLKALHPELYKTLLELLDKDVSLFKRIFLELQLHNIKNDQQLIQTLTSILHDYVRAQVLDSSDVTFDEEVPEEESQEKRLAKLSGIQTKDKKTRSTSSTKNTDKLIQEVRNLLKLKPPAVDFNEDVTPKPGLHLLKYKIDGGNIFNTTQTLEEYIHTTFAIFNEYYWSHLGYDVRIESIKPVDNLTAEGYSELLELQLVITTSTKETIRTSLFIPRIRDNFVQLGTVEYALLHQLYQVPIASFKPHTATFRSNYDAFSVVYHVKNRIRLLETHILGEKVPSILIMLLLTCSLKETLSMLNIKRYEIIPRATSEKEYDKTKVFPLSAEYALYVVDKLDAFQIAALNGLRYIKTLTKKVEAKDTSDFEKCSFWSLLTVLLTSMRFATTLSTSAQLFIDPITKSLLQSEGEPTEFLELHLELMRRAFDGKVYEPSDLHFRRARDLEVLSILLFKQINHSILVHRAATLIERKTAKFSIDPNAILKALQGDSDAATQFIVNNQDYNPLASVQLRARATYRGLDKPKFIPVEQRNLHQSYYCIIDPVDTTEGENAGDVQEFSLAASIRHMGGAFQFNKGDCHLFSPAVSLIPFVTYNDGNRVQMASTQMRQALPLVNSERPLVGTGLEHIVGLLTSSRFVVRAQQDGKVVKVTEDYIQVKNSKGNIDTYFLTKHINRYSYSYPRPIVEEGDKVRRNQIIAEDPSFFKNGTYASGVNARTVFMHYKGFGIEDSIIVSESFARKMTSKHLVNAKDISAYIPGDSKIIHLRLETGPVKSGEHLVIVKPLGARALKETLQIIPQVQDLTEPGPYLTLVSPVEGEIIDIEIYVTKKSLLQKFPVIKKFIEEKQIKVKELAKQFDVSNLPPQYKKTLQAVLPAKDTKEKDIIFVFYHIEYTEPLQLGDKLHNRHGNKGVIARILSDDLMPRDDKGPFDVILNPFGIPGRKNLGQLYELWLGSVAKEIERKIIEFYKTKQYNEIEKLLLNVYTLIDSTKERVFVNGIKAIFKQKELAKAFVEDIVRYGFTLMVGSGERITIGTINKLMNMFKVKKSARIYLPEFQTYTENEAYIGYLYLNKLEQRAKTKYSSRAIGRYEQKTLQPPGGSIEGGQKTGLYDTFSVVSYPLPSTILELYSVLSDDHDAKEQVLRDILNKGDAELPNNLKMTTALTLKAYLLGLHAMTLKD